MALNKMPAVERDVTSRFDALGRQLRTDGYHHDGQGQAWLTVLTDYDANGNKLKVSMGNAGTMNRLYAYDAANRVIAKQDDEIKNDAAQVLTERYGYDAEGMRTTVTRATGLSGAGELLARTLTLDYDFAGRVAAQRGLLDYDNTTYSGVIGYDSTLGRPIFGPITRQDQGWELKRSIFNANDGTSSATPSSGRQ